MKIVERITNAVIGLHDRYLIMVVAAFFLINQAAAQNRKIKYLGSSILPYTTLAEGPQSGHFVPKDLAGEFLPTTSQPVIGISAIFHEPTRGFYILPDNGYGARPISADFLLRIYQVDLKLNQEPKILRFIQLRDPKRLIRFELTNKDEKRFLTGADLDPEGLVVMPDGSFWISDERGPYLAHFNSDGVLIDPLVTLRTRDKAVIRSPQNHLVLAKREVANLPESRGFEGLTLREEERTLLVMLEGPLMKEVDQRKLLLIEYDVRAKGRIDTWTYLLDQPYVAEDPIKTRKVGEILSISRNQLLVVECDEAQGEQAKNKSIYRVDLEQYDGEEKILKKEKEADLLSIPFSTGKGKTFRYDYGNIEGMTIVREIEDTLGSHEKEQALPTATPATGKKSAKAKGEKKPNMQLIMVNDNNFPFSSGRAKSPSKPEDTEFIWLER